MNSSSRVFHSTVILFLLFPIILFYMAFYSHNQFFINMVKDHVEVFYLLFVIIGVIYSFLISRNSIINDATFAKRKKVYLAIFNIFILFYALFLILNATSRYSTYRSEAIDVAFFRHEMWILSSFNIPRFAWAQHFSPFLILLVPFFWITKSGIFLMFIQALFVISGGIPLYLSTKQKLGSYFLASAITLSFLTFGGLQFGYAYGFHEILFFPTLFFWSYYFYVRRKYILYVVFILLSLSVKEEISFIMIFWGFYLTIKKDLKYSITTIISGIIWYVLCFIVIFPHFNNGLGFGYWGQYSNSNGKGLFGLISFVFYHPLEFVKTLFTPKHKIDTILHSFGNISFIPFLFPLSLIIVIPSLLEKLLSSDIAAKNGFHYSAAISVVILISAIETLSNIIESNRFTKMIKYPKIFFATLIISVSLSANVLYGYHPLSPLLLGKEKGLSFTQVEFLNRTIDSIPHDKIVAAQYYIRPHINLPYWQVEDGPKENENADYVIINTDLPLIMAERDQLEDNLDKLISENRYEILVNKYGTVLFKKKGI